MRLGKIPISSAPSGASSNRAATACLCEPSRPLSAPKAVKLSHEGSGSFSFCYNPPSSGRRICEPWVPCHIRRGMTIELRWCEVPAQGQQVPAWARRAALGSDDRVFVPAAIAGSEMDAVLSAGYDGATIVQDNGHAYVPADWLNYPKAENLSIKIERSVRDFFA